MFDFADVLHNQILLDFDGSWEHIFKRKEKNKHTLTDAAGKKEKNKSFVLFFVVQGLFAFVSTQLAWRQWMN